MDENVAISEDKIAGTNKSANSHPFKLNSAGSGIAERALVPKLLYTSAIYESSNIYTPK